MARPITFRDRESLLRLVDEVGVESAGRILGQNPRRLRSWLGERGTITPSESRRLKKATTPQMVEYLGKLQRASREKSKWVTRKGKKRRRTEKQIDAALADMVDASHPSMLKRQKPTRKDIPPVMDRLGLPVAGPEAIYLNRRNRAKRRAA